MDFFLSILVSVLVGVGVYCILQPNLMRIIIGILLLSNSANLIIFVASGIKGRISPILDANDSVLNPQAADPLPQALILTAIVIGFGVIAYFLILCQEYYKDKNEENYTARSSD